MTTDDFYCQSTNLRKATSPLHTLNVKQYIWDISSGYFGPIERLRILLVTLNYRFQEFLGGPRHVYIRGSLKRTPTLTLNLRPGELVEVRTKEDILATLDEAGRNRGLIFNAEMLEYCGKRFRVLKRVDRMINEKTKRVRQLSNTVILEGAICDGKASGGCQRNCYCLWREIWLERISNPSEG